MSLYRINDGSLEALESTRFRDESTREREDLQRMLRQSIEVVAPDTLVIAEEFSDWEDSRRRIDLLCIDRDASLIVVELKRTERGGHMELQAIRYAAMVSKMTFERLVDAHERYLRANGESGTAAEERILEFLGWDEPQEEEFPRDVQILLVSADFSREITTAVQWLAEYGVNIRCVRMSPYRMGDEVVLSVEQVLPLPSAEEYQVRLREKAISERAARASGGEDTGCWFMNVGDKNPHRSWEDCRRYGVMVGGKDYIRPLRRLEEGDLIFAYATGGGYVGVGRALGKPVAQTEFVEPRSGRRYVDLDLEAAPNPDWRDVCIPVEWIATVDREAGIMKDRAMRGTACRIRQAELVEALREGFGVEWVEVEEE